MPVTPAAGDRTPPSSSASTCAYVHHSHTIKTIKTAALPSPDGEGLALSVHGVGSLAVDPCFFTKKKISLMFVLKYFILIIQTSFLYNECIHHVCRVSCGCEEGLGWSLSVARRLEAFSVSH